MSYRVTNSMMQTLLLNDMHNNLNNMLKVQQQISTQRKYGSASDNPNAVTKGMAIETMMTEGEQYIKNLRDAESWLKFTDDALMDINDLFQRMRELAIYAGDPALTDVDREAIGEELRQLKAEMMSFANSTIEGRYLFSGLTTDKVPFSLGAGGEVVYNGSDYELFWEFARGETGQVSLTGRDVFPLDETTNYLKGIEVPIGFEWKGRNEILEFKIGFRTVKVRIPERWTDEIANGVDDSEDYNRFRDPGEPLEGYSLQEIADLINNSTEMGDTSQLLKATVVTDTARGVQYLKIKSLTGEPVSLTSWPEADMQSMAEGIMGKSVATGYTAPADGKIEIRFMDSKVYSIDVEVGDGLADIVGKLNSLQDGRIWAALKTDGTNEWIDIVARNAGDEFSIDTTGSGTDLFTSGVGSEPIQMNADHTHIGFAAYMGMETSVQSKEFSSGASLGDTTDDALNIKIASGGRYADIMINDDPYLTLEELAARINGVCGDWFEAVVETDGPDGSDPFADPLDNSGENREDATQRLVLRTKDGSPFSIYDTSTSGTVHRYAESLGINTALIVPDSLVYYPDDSAGSFDENIPAILEVTVGEHVFQVRVCKNNCPTGELVAKAIVNQVNEQYGGKLLAWDENASGENFAVYALTGEPLRVVDKGYGDPRYADFTGGIAMQLEISAGIKTDAVPSIKAGDQLTPGTIRISTPGHSIDVPVIASDTLHTLAKRIQESAGSWLDVAYVDESMGTKPSAEVLMSIAAKDGSAVSIFDISGRTIDNPSDSNADVLGISTGLVSFQDMSSLPAFVTGDGVTITVNGAAHTIDLFDDAFPPSGKAVASTVEELAALINTRFQGQDIKAEVITSGTEKRLAIWSPKGYTFELSGTGQIVTALQSDGYLSGVATSPNRNGTGPYNQNVTSRTGDNQKRIDFFGVVDNLIDTVEGGNVDGISDKMLGEMDHWMSTLLKDRAIAGALISRYTTTESRYVSNGTNYTELYDKTVGIDLAEAITNFQMATSIYEASLAAIARIMQPSLLDFLR